MTILTAGSGCTKLIFLPMRFCAPYPVDVAHHFYLHFTIIYACYDALMPIKLFDYTIQLTFFLHKPTYSCYKLQIPKLRTIDTKLTNYWYKTYELLIQNLRTIDTKLTNYWYKTYELLIQNLRTIDTKLTNYWYKTYELLILNLQTSDTKPTNYQSFLLQTEDFKITNYQSFLIQTPDSNTVLQTTNPYC